MCIEKPSHIDVVIVDPGGCQWPSTGYSDHPEMVSPLPRLRLGDIKDFLSKSEKERGFLRFRLGSAGGAIGGFWYRGSNLYAVREADGVLQGQYGPQSPGLQSPVAIAIVDPEGCRWRLIGEVDGVL
ncbi:hypothetical protein SLA2020_315290 [Shorea laevis]